MLSRLFKSRARFDDPDPAIRRSAVLAIDDEEAASFQDEFAELVRADTDSGVRRAALSRLREASRLQPFLNDADADIVRAAAEAIARDGNAGELLAHPEVRNAAIRNARDLDSVTRLIGDVEWDHELIRLAVESRNPKVRLALADKLMKEASLTELEHQSRDKDKNVNRLARSRLEEIRHARGELERTLRRAEELTQTIETQMKADSDALFAARLGVVKHDWAANRARHAAATQQLAAHGVAVPSLDELAQRFDTGVTAADAIAEARRRAAPTRPAEPAVAAVAPVAAADSSAAAAESSVANAEFIEALAGLEALLDWLARGDRDAFDEADVIHAMNRVQQDRWLAAADHRPPPEALAARFHTATHSLSLAHEAVARLAGELPQLEQAEAAAPAEATAATPEEFEALWAEQRRARQTSERLTRTLERIAWPADLARPARLRAAEQLKARLGEFDRTCHTLHEQLLERLQQTITKLETQIDGGHLATATGLEGECKRLLHSLPAATAKRMQAEFVALSVRVQELKDWRTYATHPKREQFVTEMEKLAETPLEPPLQAERIRELRQAWQELGPITHHNDRRLFDRFNHAADVAFRPCRTYFDEQAATRKFNLEQRRKICEDLERYLDGVSWDHADWRAAERILYAARGEWRKYHPVDRSPGRKLDSQFDALTTRLHGKLTAQWDQNAAAKQAIVAEAIAIQAAGGEPRAAIDKIKALQQRWRSVGIVPRRIDQRLWKEFRAACDAVFEQRDTARTEQRQATESQLAVAEALCKEFQQALEGATSDTASAAELNEFSSRFQSLPELPRESARRVEQRFREMERGYRMLLRQAQHDAALRNVDRLRDVDIALAQLERRIAQGATGAADVPDQIAAIAGLDRAQAGPFAQRLQSLTTATAAALAAAAAPTRSARRKLAIEMEIAAGLDTPAQFQQDRLALQVDRLNQGLQRRRVMEEAPLQLAERWCRTGPVADDDEEVRERFFRACRIALE